MSYLSVEHSITVDFILSDESTGILAEIMEDLDDSTVFKDLFKAKREGVHFRKIKDITVTA